MDFVNSKEFLKGLLAYLLAMLVMYQGVVKITHKDRKVLDATILHLYVISTVVYILALLIFTMSR